jgi:hypothetical protein
MIDIAHMVTDSTGWLIAYGWLLPTKASFLHSRNLFVIQTAMVMIATLAALLKCPIEGEVGNLFSHQMQKKSSILCLDIIQFTLSIQGTSLAGYRNCLPLPSAWYAACLTKGAMTRS